MSQKASFKRNRGQKPAFGPELSCSFTVGLSEPALLAAKQQQSNTIKGMAGERNEGDPIDLSTAAGWFSIGG